MIDIINDDVIKWAAAYSGIKFHALLTDPPYHLLETVKRFGKPNSAPAKFGKDGAFSRASRGFMGQVWDGGDIAFNPETWSALGEHLLSGAFGVAFASARGWHRLAVAIEDAGFIIHPTIFAWGYASGFPKATRIDNRVDGGLENVWQNHRYGLQALKPASEPIIIFQKPFEGRPLDNITKSGAGALNIGATRIGLKENDGRWPANLLLVHSPECKFVGTKTVKGYIINRWTDNAHPFGGGAGNPYETIYSDEIEVESWECANNCAVRMLDEQSGILKSGKPSGERKDQYEGRVAYREYGKIPITGYGDEGGASRYFYNANWSLDIEEGFSNSDPIIYQSKASRAEREAGLENIDAKRSNYRPNESEDGYNNNDLSARIHRSVPRKNPHPAIKPLSLTQYLAKLLLPPEQYGPRRILVPFGGTMSEAIGAMLAGWEEITAIELSEEYCQIGEKRIRFWENLIPKTRQISLFKED